MTGLSQRSSDIRRAIIGFEDRIDQMHIEFTKYHLGEEQRMPDWESLSEELVVFSRRKIFEVELSRQLERIMYKFQNRKKIWLKWVEEVHGIS